jgi:hypothetical protein
MFNKKIEDFIQNTGEGVVLDYVNGQFVLENKSFVEGKPSAVGKIQGKGSTLELCIDNFLYSLEQKNLFERRPELNDIESYRWYASH